MDKTGIQKGDRWPDEIKNALINADIVIVVIGETWLTCHEADGRRRIDGEEDWVRRKLRQALQANKKIIPVLVNDATIPSPKSLPDDLKELPNLQAISVTRRNWEPDIQNLLKTIVIHAGEEHPPQKKPVFLLAFLTRRKELLNQIGWEEGVDYFTLHASVNLDVENNLNFTLKDAKKIVEKTACVKINWVMDRNWDISEKIGQSWNSSETIVIGVDTIVFCNGKILDRPLLKSLQFAGPKEIEDARKRAKEMLMEQRGCQVYIITSLAIATASDYHHPATETVVTEGELRSYSETDIDNYILYAEPFDKAGAFGIQEKGISLFKKMKGSYTNVVGLPLHEFVSLLQEKYGNTFTLPNLKSTIKSTR